MANKHKADVEALAPKLATAIAAHLKAQRSRVTRAKLDTKAETASLKAAMLPHTTAAVGAGAQRVADVAGHGTVSPTTTLAGAWAYKGASQINQTTQGQVDALTDTADTDAVDHLFDVRVGLAAAMAATLISNAINSGAQNYAATLPATQQPTKTWEVNDDHPCTECSSVDGETVQAPTTFSNGAPHGPIHDGCMCSVTWTAATTTPAARSLRMTYEEWRADKYSADDMKDLLANGKAMKNPSGDPSYPVADQEDIEKAVHAVGRGGADHDAIRLHIIKGAKALHLTSLIPDNWNADGSLTTEKSTDPDGETRADKVKCPTCDGIGKIREGNVTCPTCKGSGEVEPTVAEGTNTVASSTPRRAPRRQRRSLDRLPEFRTFRTQFERRVAQDGDDIVLTGYPIRYASPYSVRDYAGPFRETMHQGVANEAMQARDFDCRFLLNHDGMPFARSANGTLNLVDTHRGLSCEARLDSRRQDATDLAMAVERGDVTQMSCGFVVATDEWNWGDDGLEERDIYSFDELFDVSAVTYPASPTTSIELQQRMLAQALRGSTRERSRRLHALAGTIRSGKALSQHDGEELRALAEALYKVDRLDPVPELLDAYRGIVDHFYGVLRAGKVLSSDNESDINAALDALHAADDIDIPGITRSLETIDKALDAGQAALARILGRANPDGGSADQEPTLVAPDDPTADKDARARQLQRLRITQLATV